MTSSMISYYTHNETGPKNNMIYRAYRYPYSYVPQEPTPQEVVIPKIDNITYRVPNAGALSVHLRYHFTVQVSRRERSASS